MVGRRLRPFAGRDFDLALLDSFPAQIDPCGENGEFHTFTFRGPIFNKEIKYKTGEKVFKEYKSPENPDDDTSSTTQKLSGFWFCDLLPL